MMAILLALVAFMSWLFPPEFRSQAIYAGVIVLLFWSLASAGYSLLESLIDTSSAESVRMKAISRVYLEQRIRRNRIPKMILNMLSIGALTSYFMGQDTLLYFSVCWITVVSLCVQELVVKYRVLMGWFGTTKREARALIRFIVHNSEDIDFTDGLGGLIKALVAEQGNIEASVTAGVRA